MSFAYGMWTDMCFWVYNSSVCYLQSGNTSIQTTMMIMMKHVHFTIKMYISMTLFLRSNVGLSSGSGCQHWGSHLVASDTKSAFPLMAFNGGRLPNTTAALICSSFTAVKAIHSKLVSCMYCDCKLNIDKCQWLIIYHYYYIIILI